MNNSKEWRRLKKKAKIFFDDTKEVDCPAWKEERVKFNSKGLNHLFYKGPRSERTLKEISIRVSLLPRAVELLKQMPIPQEEDVSKSKKVVTYWAFEGVVSKKRVKVIVRKVGNGFRHSWSVAPAWRKSRFGRKNVRSGRLKNV